MSRASAAACLRFLGACTVALTCAAAAAQGWQPSRPIEINATTTPGGSVDLTARLIQKILQGAGLDQGRCGAVVTHAGSLLLRTS